MRNLKVFCLAAVVAISAMIGSAASGTAMAESAAVTNYKQAVTKRVEVWSNRMTKLSADLAQAWSDLAVLNIKTPRPDDIDAQIKAKQDRIKALQSTVTYETKSLEIDLAKITVSPPDKSEAIPLPGFVSDIIKAKGVPLGTLVSFVPNISWSFKSGTLGSAGGTITIKFNNP
jgi:hypothetical protein